MSAFLDLTVSRGKVDPEAISAYVRRLVEARAVMSSLGDAIAPDDAWRPWGRRKRLKHDLARLTAPPPEPPEHLQL